MTTKKKLVQAAAGSGGRVLETAVEEVFSTYLYYGTGAGQIIANGIDLSGYGGLVWTKRRNSIQSNAFYDTERGVGKYLQSDQVAAQITNTQSLTAFRSDGFRVGTAVTSNDINDEYASWSFRKAPRFFDVVTYSGTGSAQNISHNLGVEPGCIIVKRTDLQESWQVYHNSLDASAPQSKYIYFNKSNSVLGSTTMWNNTAPTSTEFTVGVDNANISGGTYVAYLFAHDPLGPSGDGSDGLIACGGYTGLGANGPEVDIGWEPQFLLIKSATSGEYWRVFDTMRGISDDVSGQLSPSLTDPEDHSSAYSIRPMPNGFMLLGGSPYLNSAGNKYIYIAIRRGLMRTPTTGTEVFSPTAYTSDNLDNRLVDTGIITDAAIIKTRSDISGENPALASRLQNRWWLQTNTSGAQINDADGIMALSASIISSSPWSSMTGFGVGNDLTAKFNYGSNTMIAHAFRRAYGFFDVVLYSGNGTSQTVLHNLGSYPELIFVKRRDVSAQWSVFSASTGSGEYLALNSTQISNPSTTHWNATAPTDANFTVGANANTNASGGTYIAYLFASCPGVSKVGSYTGNGTSQTINCGFTTGARFVLIKRTDSTGDWYVWDTARGIVAGNDPHFSLNSNAIEIATDDSVDPDSSGFIVNQDAATNINVSSASYIFYAIA